MATDHEKLVTSIITATETLEFAEEMAQSLRKKGKTLPSGVKANIENLSQELAKIMVSHLSRVLTPSRSYFVFRKSKSAYKSSSLSVAPSMPIVEHDSL